MPRMVTIGNRTQTVRQWAAERGVYHQLIDARIRAGWPAEKAVMTPPAQRERHATEVIVEFRRRVAAGEQPSSAGRALGIRGGHVHTIARGLARKAAHGS